MASSFLLLYTVAITSAFFSYSFLITARATSFSLINSAIISRAPSNATSSSVTSSVKNLAASANTSAAGSLSNQRAKGSKPLSRATVARVLRFGL